MIAPWITIRLVAIRAELPQLTGSDADSIDRSIVELLEEGWEDGEIVRWCRCTEEVNPKLEEMVALRQMRLIREAVEKRTGRTNPRCVKITPLPVAKEEGAIEKIVKARVKLNNLSVAVSNLGVTGDNETYYVQSRDIIGEISQLLVEAEIILKK